MSFNSNKSYDNLLFVEFGNNCYALSFLFFCASYFSQRGKDVLFILKTPLESLPPSVNTKEDIVQSLSTYEKIRFMYITNSQDLTSALSCVYVHPNPATIILISQLETYDCPTSVCAALQNAAFVVANRTAESVVLIATYANPQDDETNDYLFTSFRTIWTIEDNNMGIVTLKNLDPHHGKPQMFQFKNNFSSNLVLEKVFKAILDEESDCND